MAPNEKRRFDKVPSDNELVVIGEAPTVRASDEEPNTMTAERVDRPNPFRALDPTATTPKMPSLEPGTVVKHYEFLRQLGAGGMGTVFLARDTRLGRLVARTIGQLGICAWQYVHGGRGDGVCCNHHYDVWA